MRSFGRRGTHRGPIKRVKDGNGGVQDNMTDAVRDAIEALKKPGVKELQVVGCRNRLGLPSRIIRIEKDRVFFQPPHSRHSDDRHVLDVRPVAPA